MILHAGLFTKDETSMWYYRVIHKRWDFNVILHAGLFTKDETSMPTKTSVDMDIRRIWRSILLSEILLLLGKLNYLAVKVASLKLRADQYMHTWYPCTAVSEVWSFVGNFEAEFKEFKSRLKSAKIRFKLSASLNTILSETNHN